MTLAQLITFVTTLIGSPTSGSTPGTGLIGWCETFINFITSNPIVLVFVITPILFWGLGAIKRMLRL